MPFVSVVGFIDKPVSSRIFSVRLYFFPVCRRLSRMQSPAPPRQSKNRRCSGGIVIAPHLDYRLSQSLASSPSPSCCASFLCVDTFLPSAGASHRRSLLRPLVGAKIGGAPGELFWRRISFTVCLSRWLHQQTRLVAHLLCVLIFFSRLQAPLKDAVSCAPSSEQKLEELRGNCSGAATRLPFVSVVGFINKLVSLRIFSVC